MCRWSGVGGERTCQALSKCLARGDFHLPRHSDFAQDRSGRGRHGVLDIAQQSLGPSRVPGTWRVVEKIEHVEKLDLPDKNAPQCESK